MKKKMLMVSLVLAMTGLALTGCGNKEEGVQAEEQVEESSEPVLAAEEAVEAIPEGQENSTEAVEEGTEVIDYGFDVYANAEEKFQRLHDAYFDILDGTDHPGAYFLEITQDNIEKGTANNYDINNEEIKMYLSNGDLVNNINGIFAILQGYYAERINNNKDWYDIKEWTAQFDTEEELENEFCMLGDDGEYHEVDLYMCLVAAYAATIVNANEVTFGEPIEENFEYSGGHESAYKMPIVLDGADYHLYAVFDAEGNLINIDDLESEIPVDKLVYTWGEDVDHKQ